MRNFDLPGRSPVIAENGMAATSHPLATATALSVLKDGGNAVDAAIAAAATLAVVEPHMTGIGGDCFVILAEPDSSLHGLNGSGRAPAGANAAWYRERGFTDMPATGPHSVTVPGAIKAWEVLSQRFGTRGFDRLFLDAIRYAEEGFAIHPRVARDWARYASELAADEGGAMHYLPNGRTPPVFARHRLPALGATLRQIAERGSVAFYEGEVATEIARTVREKGGFLTEEDLAKVSADWVDPITTAYRGHDVFEIPPSGQGLTALIMLNLMKQLGADRTSVDGTDRWHLMIEAARLAYAVRDSHIADPASMNCDTRDLLDLAYARALAGGFLQERRNDRIVLPPVPNSDTVYLCVVDRDRRAVSFINSLYSGFGSRIVTPNSGVVLQNRGACFTLKKGHPNELAPAKRPMHTIIPGMAMKAGKPSYAFGVMGGAYQPMGHALVLSNMLDFGMDPQQAIDFPRLFWGEDGTLEAEAGIPAGVREGLAAKGHTLRDALGPWGGAQLIAIDHESGFLIGGSDPRKDGCALGW
ncbi:gamma-glutamyltransferase family protein [Aquibium oceanicum]|uniref:Gamma-glutamyltranspeptidase n=1 Tax=Aquibium oceanicum TaxID=1670800 RepID=A0A1L3SY78_9HYPH|nr:gamma-glutamyltransferase family protein [Aquibium oceanicum]APH74272.1 gamma-glutamyltranspeptidase [Aquibium oceanicum]